MITYRKEFLSHVSNLNLSNNEGVGPKLYILLDLLTFGLLEDIAVNYIQLYQYVQLSGTIKGSFSSFPTTFIHFNESFFLILIRESTLFSAFVILTLVWPGIAEGDGLQITLSLKLWTGVSK